MKRAGDGDEEITAISNRENSIGQSTQERTPWSKRSASRTCRALKSVRLARSTPLVSPSTTVLRTISTYNFLISFERLSVPFASSTERSKLFIRRDIVIMTIITIVIISTVSLDPKQIERRSTRVHLTTVLICPRD